MRERGDCAREGRADDPIPQVLRVALRPDERSKPLEDKHAHVRDVLVRISQNARQYLKTLDALSTREQNAALSRKAYAPVKIYRHEAIRSLTKV